MAAYDGNGGSGGGGYYAVQERYSWVRVSKREPCPICGGVDWCGVTSNGSLAHCMRVADGATSDASDGGWLHRLGDSNGSDYSSARPRAVIPPQVEPTADRLSLSLYDRLAREIMSLFPLSPEHRAALQARGMDDDLINRRGYRTLTKEGVSAKLRHLCTIFAVEDVMKFPGVARKVSRHGPYLTLNASAGLLVPSVNVDGQIVGFRVRPDTTDGGKYRWLSSPEGGASSGAPVHVSRPYVVRDAHTVWITEGEIKADIVSYRYGVVCIAVPGVSITSEVPAVVDALARQVNGVGGSGASDGAAPAVLNVVIAYDADKHDPRKPSIMIAERKLARALAPIAYVYEASWDIHRSKGIDDLIVSGSSPTVNYYPFPATAEAEQAIRADEHARATVNARAEDEAHALWSVVPVTRGPVERSKWCMRARMFGMSGDGIVFDYQKRCGRWDCPECAMYKLQHEILPHVVLCIQPQEEVWIGRVEIDDSTFRMPVMRARRAGHHPRYFRVLRVPIDDAPDADNLPWVVANMDLGSENAPFDCYAPVDAYQIIRHDLLRVSIPGIKRITWCEQWRIPEKPKRDSEGHIYTLPHIHRRRFDQLAEQAFEQFGVRSTYRDPIPDPEVRKFMDQGLRDLRRPDNTMNWSLENEEWQN